MNERDSILAYSTLVSCSCSVFITGIFLCFYIKFGQIRNNFASQLILILAICDLLCWGQVLLTILYIIFTGSLASNFDSSICTYLALFQHTSSLLVMIIDFLISFSIYLSTVRNIEITDYKLTIASSTIIFIIILSMLPFITNDYGVTNSVFCWIIGNDMKFFGYYMIIFIVFIVDFYCITKTLCVIKKLPIQQSVKAKLKKHLIFFPLIFIFSYSAGFITSFVIFLNPEIDTYWLSVLDLTFQPTDGILNPLAYMLINEQVLNGVKKIFRRSDEKEENQMKTSIFSTYNDEEEIIPKNNTVPVYL